MLKKRNIRFNMAASLAAMLLGQSLIIPAAYGSPAEALTPQESAASANTGKWMTGEYHTHTYESNDAQESLKDVLDNALEKNGLDWLALADHLRVSDRDDEGAALPGGSIPMSQGIASYQMPIIKQLQAEGKYAGKIIFSGFEWDMPQYDHAAVGIVTDEPGSEAALKAINQFEYLFSNRDVKMFDPADVAAWSAADNRAYSTKTDTRTAIQWLSDHYPESYVLINHPSRKNGSSSELKIADVRDFNNIDPHVAFGFEGMLGNQMAPDRGETVQVYGGADVKVAQVGGFWDALLGEGRRFWNFANSDFHFKTSRDNKYSSGYWPGEYSKNYTWVDGSNINAVVDGMRSGKSFSVFGDLINALDFNLAADGKKEETGGELQITEGDNLELTVRFKSPDKNNNGDPVQVDHVDLISGEVSGKVQPGTPEYDKATNESTKVVARFTSADWTTDAEGYNVITYKLGAADKDRYYRLRGTNLGVNVPGETSNGEPLLDVKNLTVDNATRFAEINNRNYQDLWFYSNPIFVDVAPYSDKQAVEETAASLNLGDTTGVTANLELPGDGKHGAQVKWESGNSSVLNVENGVGHVTRPAAGQPDASVLLKATITRGTESAVKTFELIIKAMDYTDAEAVQLAKEKLTLGDIGAVKSDLYLPAAGEQGTGIAWKSSTPLLMTSDGKIVFQPQRDTKLTLTATIRRGNAVEEKTFEVTLRGDAGVIPLALHGTLQTADGDAYLSGAWTNQSVTVSVYANVYVPGSDVTIHVRLDGETEGKTYGKDQAIELTAEGRHGLEFQAGDNLGNTASLPVAVNIDRTAPVISLKGSSSMTLVQGTSFVDPGTEITDMLGIAGPVAVTGTVDTQNPGTYTLRYNARDLAGNTAQEVVRTVVVTAPSSSGENGGDGGNGGNGGTGGTGGNGGTTGTVTPPVTTPPVSSEQPSAAEVKVEVPAQQGGSGSLPGVASFNIPAGALSADATLTLTALATGEAPAAGQLKSLSPAVEFAASSASKLGKQVELSLSYAQEQISSGHKPAVYYYNEQRDSWIYLGGTANPDSTVTVNVSRFATYAVMDYQPLLLSGLGNHWAGDYTDRLIGMGVMKGFEDQSFRPNEPVTRAQFASIIARALGLKASGSPAAFTDQSAIPAWAAGDVAAAVSSGILQGYESAGQSFFRGSENITRAEMSVMLANALKTSSVTVTAGDSSTVLADQSVIPAWAEDSVKAGMTAGILSGFEDKTFRPDKTATRAEAAAAVYKLLAALSI
ncbi:Endoglucanase precursor [compost metagenome]